MILDNEFARYKKILKNIPRAIIKPGSTFGNLGSDFPFPLILSLFVFRILHIWLHLFLVHPGFYSQEYSNPFALMSDFFNPVRGLKYVYFLMLVSVTIFLVSKVLRKKIEYESIEEGIFYVLTAPLILTLLDLPTLFIEPLQSIYLWHVGMHISYPILLIIMPLQLSYILEQSWGLSKKFTFLPLISIPIWFKYRIIIYQKLGLTRPWPIYNMFLIVSGILVLSFYFKERKWKRFGLVAVLFPYAIYLFLLI